MHWKLLKIVKWGYVTVSEVVGWAGVPDDVKQWETWTGESMEQAIQFLNLYPTRVFLVLSGIVVMTYPRWWIPIRQLIFTKEDPQSLVAPPKVTPHGGKKVSLEVRSTVSARHYGYVWFTGENVTRTEKSNLLWLASDSDREHLHKGDLGTIRIGGLLNRSVQKDGRDFYVHQGSERSLPFIDLRSDGLRMRVELRAEGVEESWIHHYQIRKTGLDSLEIVED